MDVALRQQIHERAGDCCEYCQMPQQYDVLPFQVDHIIAEKHDGPTVTDNLALSCYNCNTHKGPNIAGRDPQTGQLTPLFHPREQGTEVELTATGWEKLGARGPRERKGYNIGWGSVLDTYAGRWSPAIPVFAAVSGIIVTWQKLTGRYQAAIDAAGGRIPGKSLKGGDGQ